MRTTIAGLGIFLLFGAAARAATVQTPQHSAQESAQDYLEGVLLFQKGDYEGARQQWTAALKADPSNQDAKIGLEKLDKLYGVRDSGPVQAESTVRDQVDPGTPVEGLRRAMDQAQSGMGLSPAAVQALEAGLKAHPDDLAARHRLLGYYSQAQFSSDAARDAHDRQVLWLIQHHPEDLLHPSYGGIMEKMSPAAYKKGSVLWRALAVVHDADPLVLSHAADYLILDDPASAEKILIQGAKLEPRNASWPSKLGSLYSLHAAGDPKKADAALEQFETARALSEKEADRFYNLDDLVKTAYDAGRYDKAKKYAGELLTMSSRFKDDWNFGNAILLGNMTLGRVALRDGKKAEAVRYLLASGTTPGSPQLQSFGPNMSLAAELLAAGESKAVLRYFEECRAFWKNDNGLLDQWERAVKDGKAPDFGANLTY